MYVPSAEMMISKPFRQLKLGHLMLGSDKAEGR